MAGGISYEGDGFIRVFPSAPARRHKRRDAVPVREVLGEAALANPTAAEVEQRARAMRREYLSEWLCRLLDRWN